MSEGGRVILTHAPNLPVPRVRGLLAPVPQGGGHLLRKVRYVHPMHVDGAVPQPAVLPTFGARLLRACPSSPKPGQDQHLSGDYRQQITDLAMIQSLGGISGGPHPARSPGSWPGTEEERSGAAGGGL